MPTILTQIDDAAVDAAVLRAGRSIGRVLVLEGSADASEWHGLPAVEALASAGWSVMVSVPVGNRPGGSADRAVRDRMVDLGVDVRAERREYLLSLYGEELVAVVAPEEGTHVGLSLTRHDGSSIPLLNQEEHKDQPLAARVAALVRRDVESPPGVGALRSVSAVANHDPSQGALDPPGVVTAGIAGSSEAAGTDVTDASQRDLKFAEADLRIRDEYREYLECELARLQAVIEETDVAFRRLVASFDEKEHYIDSLLSVRVKKWIRGRRPNRGS